MHASDMCNLILTAKQFSVFQELLQSIHGKLALKQLARNSNGYANMTLK